MYPKITSPQRYKGVGKCRTSPSHSRPRGRTEHREPQEHEGAACGWREVRGRKREVGCRVVGGAQTVSNALTTELEFMLSSRGS